VEGVSNSTTSKLSLVKLNNLVIVYGACILAAIVRAVLKLALTLFACDVITFSPIASLRVYVEGAEPYGRHVSKMKVFQLWPDLLHTARILIRMKCV